MIRLLCDYASVGDKTINFHAHIEYDHNDDSITDKELEVVATKAMKKVCFKDEKLYGVFSEYIKNCFELFVAGRYEYPTIQDMINDRDEKYYEKWQKKHTMIEEHFTEVLGYKVHLEVSIDK